MSSTGMLVFIGIYNFKMKFFWNLKIYNKGSITFMIYGGYGLV